MIIGFDSSPEIFEVTKLTGKKKQQEKKAKRVLRKERLFCRRLKLASLIYKGYDTGWVFNVISKEFGVKPEAIIKDWQRRDSWLGIIFWVENGQRLMNDVRAERKAIKYELWETQRRAIKQNNMNAAVGALNKLANMNDTDFEFAQKQFESYSIESEQNRVKEFLPIDDYRKEEKS